LQANFLAWMVFFSEHFSSNQKNKLCLLFKVGEKHKYDHYIVRQFNFARRIFFF